MDSETVDLSDPLQELLHRTGWSAEDLQQRLLELTRKKNNQVHKPERQIRDTTLEILPKESKTLISKVEPEIIVLSDDEELNIIPRKVEEETADIKLSKVIVNECDSSKRKSEHFPYKTTEFPKRCSKTTVTKSDFKKNDDSTSSFVDYNITPVISPLQKENHREVIMETDSPELSIIEHVNKITNLNSSSNVIINMQKGIIYYPPIDCNKNANKENDTSESSLENYHDEIYDPLKIDEDMMETQGENENPIFQCAEIEISTQNSERTENEDFYKAFQSSSCSTSDDCEEEIVSENNSFNLEDIRANLKLQLSSLRTRKNVHLLDELQTKVVEADYIVKSSAPSENLLEDSDSSTLILQQSETNNEPVNNNEVDNNSQCTGDMDKVDDETIPNVFNEIRKIINKKKEIKKEFKKLYSPKLKIKINNSKAIPFTDKESVDAKEINQNKKTSPKSVLTTEKLLDAPTDASSPFVSNTLDEFLTDSKLNVSYTIPKSNAEEGLVNKYSDETIAVPVVVRNIDKDVNKPKQANRYKPKTLAEKRRFLEQAKLREQKHLSKMMKVKEKNTFVLFKDKRIYLKTNKPGGCIARIECTKTSEIERQYMAKPSLLTELFKRNLEQIRYKPGPLSKKPLLQNVSTNWFTTIKRMPRVILDISVEVGKPVHPGLRHLLPQWNGVISEDQIDFALAAVISKNDNTTNTYSFSVPYERNEEQIIVRQKILENPIISDCCGENNLTDEDQVKAVISKLIDYVEIKELESTLIKEDETILKATPGESTLKHTKSTLTFRKKPRSKIDMELMRLNCKLVNVEVEENEPKDCDKDHCALGCVCNSLKCFIKGGGHCRDPKCMFGCKCSKAKKNPIHLCNPVIQFPAGTNILSTDTVSRIEDEAKKDLAKVEKEFTQTVIYAHNKPIVLGCGYKARRATKLPKKYSDYEDEDYFKEPIKEVKSVERIETVQCSVNLEKWNFADITPFCLVHLVHDCYCKGQACFPDKDSITLSKLLKPSVTSFSLKDYKAPSQEEFLEENKRRQNVVLPKLGRPKRKWLTEEMIDETYTPYEMKKKKHDDITHKKYNKIERIKIIYEDTDTIVGDASVCSRTDRPFDKKLHKSRIVTKSDLICDFINTVTDRELQFIQSMLTFKQLSDSDRLKIQLVEDNHNDKSTSTSDKRKPKVIIKSIDPPFKQQNIQVSNAEDFASMKKVFEDEIVVPNGMLMTSVVKGNARILPWTALYKGFQMNKIRVYCVLNSPFKLVLTVGLLLHGPNVMEVSTHGQEILDLPINSKLISIIEQTEKVREIISWLISGNLPDKYNGIGLAFLLVEIMQYYFEVRGTCIQSSSKEERKSESIDSVQNELQQLTEYVEVKHKDMNYVVQTLYVRKMEFRLKELFRKADNLAESLYMWTALPTIDKVGKWRVLFLNNDFAYLYFKTVKYSIKYIDLIKLTNMAKDAKRTLCLSNRFIRNSSGHKQFGLYISPNYTDRIFIGPYFINDDNEDVETLRYINKSLVSSESFNRMKGNTNYKCGHWLYERPDPNPQYYIKDVLDLTKDNSLPQTVVEIPDQKVSETEAESCDISLSDTSIVSTLSNSNQEVKRKTSNTNKTERILVHNGNLINIMNAKPRAPSEFNRFILTNIPDFGYLGAYQPIESTVLEVSWPFEKKVLQFDNKDSAKQFLLERFNQLLQPVPETFKIEISILQELDIKKYRPVDAKYLSGHCICGPLGAFNVKQLTEQFCQVNLGISRDGIMQLFKKRAQEYLKGKIQELAALVGIQVGDMENYNMLSILTKAKEEIKNLEKVNRENCNTILQTEKDLENKLDMIKDTIKGFPKKYHAIESNILNDILKIRPRTINTSEVVEIKDDDDDEEPHVNSGSETNKVTVFKPTSHSVLKTSIVKPMLQKLCLKQIHTSEGSPYQSGESPERNTVKYICVKSAPAEEESESTPPKPSTITSNTKLKVKITKAIPATSTDTAETSRTLKTYSKAMKAVLMPAIVNKPTQIKPKLPDLAPLASTKLLKSPQGKLIVFKGNRLSDHNKGKLTSVVIKNGQVVSAKPVP